MKKNYNDYKPDPEKHFSRTSSDGFFNRGSSVDNKPYNSNQFNNYYKLNSSIQRQDSFPKYDHRPLEYTPTRSRLNQTLESKLDSLSNYNSSYNNTNNAKYDKYSEYNNTR
jgi:hypothetical protein